jgi:polyamine oxidase
MLCCQSGPYLASIGYLASIALCARAGGNDTFAKPGSKDASVLILGGGVSGIIAARTLNENGIINFRIVEARDELGGRLYSTPFGAPGKQKTVEATPSPPD